MSESKLASKLAAIVPEPDVVDAANNFADAYAEYVTDSPLGTGAQALTPITAAGVALGKAAMAAALTSGDISASGAAAGGLKAAFAAFWAGVAGGLAVSFAAATAITPPSFSSLNLQPVFDTATDDELTQAEAADLLAAAIHGAVGGGTVTTPPSTVTPIT